MFASFLSFTAQILQQIKKNKREDDSATQMWGNWKFNIYNAYNVVMWWADKHAEIVDNKQLVYLEVS